MEESWYFTTFLLTTPLLVYLNAASFPYSLFIRKSLMDGDEFCGCSLFACGRNYLFLVNLQPVRKEREREKQKVFCQKIPTFPERVSLVTSSPFELWISPVNHMKKGHEIKKTTLERDDFITLQLLMFVTAKKERAMFTIFFLSIFYSTAIPAISSWNRPSASRTWKLRPTGLEVGSF